MKGHDITPGPMGANPIFERLFEGMRSLGLQAATPVPQYPVDDTPADRSDDTREAASTGV